MPFVTLYLLHADLKNLVWFLRHYLLGDFLQLVVYSVEGFGRGPVFLKLFSLVGPLLLLFNKTNMVEFRAKQLIVGLKMSNNLKERLV